MPHVIPPIVLALDFPSVPSARVVLLFVFALFAVSAVVHRFRGRRRDAPRILPSSQQQQPQQQKKRTRQPFSPPPQHPPRRILPPRLNISQEEEAIWAEATTPFSRDALKYISRDLKVRNILGSRFISNRSKRVHYLVQKVTAQTEWIPVAKPSELLATAHDKFAYGKEFRQLVLPLTLHGNASSGHPVAFFDLAEADWRRAQHAAFSPRLMDYVALHQEALLNDVRLQSEWTEAFGGVQPPYIAIFNISGLTLVKIKQGFDLGFGSIAQLWGNQYPESLAKVFICNAPGWVSVLWKIVSPFVEPDTLDKITILSAGAHLDALARAGIDLDVVPAALGGLSEGHVVVRDSGVKYPPRRHLP